jgi:N6-adenosine-specific RNA methylase IME4
MKFRTILCDPPWEYGLYSEKGRSPEKHYPTLDHETLRSLPVASVADSSCVLLLWCTWPKAKEGIEVMESWGFRFVTGFPWVKMARQGVPRISTGVHFRGCSEPLLIGVRGSGYCGHTDPPVGILFNPPGRHSAKPEAQYDLAERYPGAYLEMFARPDGGLFPCRDNWTRIGNEMDGKDIREALELLAVTPQKMAEKETSA